MAAPAITRAAPAAAADTDDLDTAALARWWTQVGTRDGSGPLRRLQPTIPAPAAPGSADSDAACPDAHRPPV